MDDYSVLGKNLKEIRTEMGLSLDTVSYMTGVSKTMLSQIERMQSVPTLAVVWKISNGLKIRIETLIKDTTTSPLINSIDNITPLTTDESDVLIYNILPFSPSSGFEVFYCIFKPGSNYLSEGHLNSISEHCFITEGEIGIYSEGVTRSLKKGDFISFDATKKHSYVNSGTTNAVVHIILNYN